MSLPSPEFMPYIKINKIFSQIRRGVLPVVTRGAKWIGAFRLVNFWRLTVPNLAIAIALAALAK